MRTLLGLVLLGLPAVAWAADLDADGLDDDVESYWGLNPTTHDSDGDGLQDGTEWGSGAQPADFDGDLVYDALDIDDDNDGVETQWEVLQAAALYLVDPHLRSDYDEDTLLDGEEWENWLDAGSPACSGTYSGYLTAADDDIKPFYSVVDGWSCAFDGFIDPAEVEDAALSGGAWVACGTSTGQGPDVPWDRDCDGVPNFMDTDDDGDGIPTVDEDNKDVHESCPAYGYSETKPGDGIPNYLDRDSDGDNSTATGQPAQGSDAEESILKDFDLDALWDVWDCNAYGLDEDTDGDGLTDSEEIDYCDDYSVSTCWSNADTDSDGLPDPQEIGFNHDLDPAPDMLDGDDDEDTVATNLEAIPSCDDPAHHPALIWYVTYGWACVDSGGGYMGEVTWPNHDAPGSGAKYTDDVPDWLDQDDNGDGIATANQDANGNGDLNDDDADNDDIPDWLDPVADPIDTGDPDTEPEGDQDGDGIPDAVEGTDDLDGDGVPNDEDPDADGDGASDAAEGAEDKDGNGVPDFLDAGADGQGGAPSSPVYGIGCQHAPASLGLGWLGLLLLTRRVRRS